MKISLLFIFIFCSCFTFAQDIKDGMGRTYYENNTSIKEIYHYILNYKFLRDPITQEIIKDTTVLVKNGPYLLYHKNGKLAASGHYTLDKKSGEWKTYNQNGELIKTENY